MPLVAAPLKAPRVSPPAGAVRVLLVDDREENLLTLEAVLASLGIEAVGARSGTEALRQVLREDFALILLDVNMPGMDGLETAAMIRQRPSSARTPIIFITADPEQSGLREAYSLGAVDYLLTPIDPSILRTKVGVFVDLHRKTIEVREQGERLRAAEAELRRRAEERYRSADERLRRMIESAQDYAIFSLAEDGTVNGWNSGAERLLGYAAEEVCGRAEAEIVVPATGPGAAASAARLDEARRAGRSEHDVTFVRGDGRRFLGNAVTTPILGDRGELLGFTEVVRDVTEARRVEQERVEEARRKDEFIAVLAHELRNPLAAIGSAAAICLSPDLRERWGQALEIITRQVSHLARLTDDLLDVSRLSRGRIELRRQPLDARAAVRGAADAVLPAILARGHRLLLQVGDDPLPVEADAVRLEQVVGNLLANAAKYSPEPGEIEVRAGLDGDEVVISVRDQGEGIAPGMAERIFDMFVQADGSLARSSGGLGIGLTLARHLVTLHGGTIAARSDGPGEGAEFTVRLPRARPAGAERRAPVAGTDAGTAEETDASAVDPVGAVPPGVRRACRVAVVDDNRDSADLLAMLLGHWGHPVDVAYDGESALELVRRHRPAIVLLDIGLPLMDGYAVARRIREEWPDTRLVAVSGYGQEQDRRRAREAGFDHHLLKPLDYDALHAVLAGAGGAEPARLRRPARGPRGGGRGGATPPRARAGTGSEPGPRGLTPPGGGLR